MAICKYIFEGKHDEYPQFYAEAPTHEELLQLVLRVTGWHNFYINDPENIRLLVSLFSCTIPENRWDDDGSYKKYIVENCSGEILYNEDVMPFEFLRNQFERFKHILRVNVIDIDNDDLEFIEIDSEKRSECCEKLIEEILDESRMIDDCLINTVKGYEIRYVDMMDVADDTYRYLEEKGYLEKMPDPSQALFVGGGGFEYEFYFIE